jgi:hypothetical protein
MSHKLDVTPHQPLAGVCVSMFGLATLRNGFMTPELKSEHNPQGAAHASHVCAHRSLTISQCDRGILRNPTEQSTSK